MHLKKLNVWEKEEEKSVYSVYPALKCLHFVLVCFICLIICMQTGKVYILLKACVMECFFFVSPFTFWMNIILAVNVIILADTFSRGRSYTGLHFSGTSNMAFIKHINYIGKGYVNPYPLQVDFLPVNCKTISINMELSHKNKSLLIYGLARHLLERVRFTDLLELEADFFICRKYNC